MGVTIGGKKGGEKKPLVQSSAKPAAAASKAGESAAIIAALTKDKGQGIVITGLQIPKVTRVPTGCFEFDLATGGGFPKSRISIIYGPESSGKTNIALRAAKTVQQTFPPECNKVVWIDLEHALDPAWLVAHGIDLEKLIVVSPGYGEEAVDAVDALVRADDVALVIVDSIAAIVAAKEVEKSTEEYDVGTSALLNKRMINKLVVALTREERRGHKPAVVVVNQTRFKIGVTKGNPETIPGGKAQLFAASLIVRMSGKNVVQGSINPDVPAWKETSCIIKKAKVPITAAEFGYNMAMVPQDFLGVGETNAFNTVANHLKALGVLKKVDKGQGWTFDGMTFKTLVELQDNYIASDEFAIKMQGMVVEARSNAVFTIDPAIDKLQENMGVELEEETQP